MKHLIAMTAIAALMSGGCSAHSAPLEPPAQNPPVCMVTVTFGSYAMGIDRGAFDAIDKLLARDGAVLDTQQKRWGREGEVTVCVQTKGAVQSKRLFAKIKALFPAKPRGPLTVETREGARFEAGAKP